VRIPSALLLFAIFVGTAASATTFDIHYVPNPQTVCIGPICVQIPGTPFDDTFSLTSTQLGSNGTYDITSTLNQFSGYFPPPSGATVNLTADATVAGGTVSSIFISFSSEYTNPFDGAESNVGFSASNGTFNSEQSSFIPGGGSSSSSQSGTYTVSAVAPAVTPEPAALSLLGAGLLAVFRRRRVS
jgi:PEP-CTERM motif